MSVEFLGVESISVISAPEKEEHFSDGGAAHCCEAGALGDEGAEGRDAGACGYHDYGMGCGGRETEYGWADGGGDGGPGWEGGEVGACEAYDGMGVGGVMGEGEGEGDGLGVVGGGGGGDGVVTGVHRGEEFEEGGEREAGPGMVGAGVGEEGGEGGVGVGGEEVVMGCLVVAGFEEEVASFGGGGDGGETAHGRAGYGSGEFEIVGEEGGDGGGRRDGKLDGCVEGLHGDGGVLLGGKVEEIDELRDEGGRVGGPEQHVLASTVMEFGVDAEVELEM